MRSACPTSSARSRRPRPSSRVGVGQINTAINHLDQMTQQNAALVEQSSAAADSLREQARQLAQAVRTFKPCRSALSRAGPARRW
jgi:ABC-type transporter Mla subunit MlaD